MDEIELDEKDEFTMDYENIQMRQEPHLIKQIFNIQKSLNIENNTDLNYKISMFIINLEMLEDMCINNRENSSISLEDIKKVNDEGVEEIKEKSYYTLIDEFKRTDTYQKSTNKSFDLARFKFRLLYGSLFSSGSVKIPLKIR